MNTGQIVANRRNFIEHDIGKILAVKKDFDKIKYAHSGSTDAEYIRISDIIGSSVTLDVTALSLEDIFEEVCRVVLITEDHPIPPRHLIDDRDKLRKIAPLFK